MWLFLGAMTTVNVQGAACFGTALLPPPWTWARGTGSPTKERSCMPEGHSSDSQRTSTVVATRTKKGLAERFLKEEVDSVELSLSA